MTPRAPIPNLWTGRSPEDTQSLYDSWASDYDGDMKDWGYVGPDRCAELVARLAPDVPVLDYGCGTGLSGRALRDRGVSVIDGVDISDEMARQARDTGVYRSVTVQAPEASPTRAEDIQVIVACGVVSFGAAPASLLSDLVALLPTGGHLVFTYNDTTLASAEYLQALTDVQISGAARLEVAEYGPQLPGQNRGCTVYGLRKL